MMMQLTPTQEFAASAEVPVVFVMSPYDASTVISTVYRFAVLASPG